MKKLLLLLSILILNSNIALAANNLISADWWKKATLEDVKAEIAKGANVKAVGNYKNPSGKVFTNVTPLMFALKYNNTSPEIVKTLIEAGADVNARNNLGTTILMYAAEYSKNPDIIKTLIDAGADVNAKNDSGATALMSATNPVAILENINKLINAGADVNAKDNNGGTALMFAVQSDDNIEKVKALINAGADVNAKRNDNLSVLMGASLNNENPEIIKILINAGADVNFKFNDDTGNIYNALFGAAYHNKNPEVIKVLINAGAKDNADAYRKTAAFYAMIRNPNHKIFEILVEDRIDYFCQINNKISSEVYYCKDRLTSYMQKENRLPSCVNNVSAMLTLTPYIGLSKATINDGVYDIVVMGNIASQFNCSLSATFNEMLKD